MKAKCNIIKDKFVPFSVTVTFDSESEARGFYHIFNHGSITKAANISGSKQIRDAIEEGLPSAYSGYYDFVKELRART